MKSKNKNLLVKTIITILIPVIVYLFFLIIDFQRFSNPQCIRAILIQSIIPTITAYAVSFGFICGIFDMTIGSWMILSALVGGLLSAPFGLAGLILGCMSVSFVLSLISGTLNWCLRLPSIVLTMGLAMIYEIVGGKIAGSFSYITLSREYSFLGSMPGIFFVFAASVGLYYVICNHTRFSFHMKAVGSQEGIAKAAGINPARIKFFAFMFGSIFVGISSLLTISQSGSVGAQVNLESIALLFKPLMGVILAMVMQPICNLTFGIIIGQITLNTIFIGLLAVGIPDTFQNVVLGLFLLIILIFSNNINRIKAYKAWRTRKRDLLVHPM